MWLTRPYNWLMNYNYLSLGTYGTQVGGTVPAALQACASDPTNDYIVANDGPTLKAALLTFLNAALKTPVRFSS